VAFPKLVSPPRPHPQLPRVCSPPHSPFAPSRPPELAASGGGPPLLQGPCPSLSAAAPTSFSSSTLGREVSRLQSEENLQDGKRTLNSRNKPPLDSIAAVGWWFFRFWIWLPHNGVLCSIVWVSRRAPTWYHRVNKYIGRRLAYWFGWIYSIAPWMRMDKCCIFCRLHGRLRDIFAGDTVISETRCIWMQCAIY
jgi:hypothetical protein